jgi:hypothetical protein
MMERSENHWQSDVTIYMKKQIAQLRRTNVIVAALIANKV